MKNLFHPLVDEVGLGDRTYRLDLSFDTVLIFFELMNDDKLSDIDKIIIATENFLPDFNPQDAKDDGVNPLDIAIEVTKYVLELLTTSDDTEEPIDDEEQGEEKEEPQEQYYCLVQDAKYIYASFMQEYGIDLYDMQGKLHWFKFTALLDGMRDTTKFKEIVGVRASKLPTGKGTEDERKRLKKLKRLYALKSTQADTHDELQNMFDRLKS